MTYHSYNQGTLTQRIGADSQLLFGYCPFSLSPISEGYVSPSGNLYSKEGILEYLLTRSREIKALKEAYDIQEASRQKETDDREIRRTDEVVQSFIDNLDGVASVIKRKAGDSTSNVDRDLDGEANTGRRERRKILDDRSKEEKNAELGKIAVN